MENIYKYNIYPSDKQRLMIRCKSINNILSVDEQDGNIVAYALRDDENQFKYYDFIVVGTGHPVHFNRNEYKFLGTVKLYDGKFMFHVFCKEL